MFEGKLFFLYEIKEAALNWKVFRWFYALLFLFMAKNSLRKEELYKAVSFALNAERDIRAINSAVVPNIVQSFLLKHLDGSQSSWRSLLISYRKSELARWHRRKYCSFELPDRLRVRQPRVPSPPERQGALFILKPHINPNEKGVILLNYDETIDTFFALYNVEKLAQDYRIVVEPSAWGYQQARIHLLKGLPTDVVVQSQYFQDSQYIQSLGQALRPIRLGAGDWADPEMFRSGYDEEKVYDLVMIANWLKWKRHKLLFKAMKRLGESIGRVALIGYSLQGRTSDEIKELADSYKVSHKIDVYENIAISEVAGIIRKSKVGIMLSKKEGANRGIYECFFSDVPVILSSCNIGVNRDHINEHTGILADDGELSLAIESMIRDHRSYRPRNWAMDNTGCLNSSQKLNSYIKGIAASSNENWTQDLFPKKNIPVPFYLNSDPISIADREVAKLERYLLDEAR